ncbi:LysR substrate-binding domain-containing protein [Amycolatopsis mongoliensis]|uniref:LysR substrate-binding domain-containing protein n=1 Tax=Amycolatopsis mongoliensis TaxID=715475 RepID=A0A9Y2JRT1_9PSEU|nr:LysR substrate-binding domain-containing protein [Amycolatopsis sp. 4-36]WIY02394.1 LysR substrate-binding domain-containing protein [Amycolatopsis sp. 4-36]
MEIREMRAFVAVAEAGVLSRAARQLHVSQPALSQTITALERRLGVQLLVRTSTGVQVTDAGATLLGEARAVLARHDQAVAAMARHTTAGGGVLRVGIPLELPPELLPSALARLAGDCPDTRVQARHLSSVAQVAALRADELDVGLVRERPAGPDLDALLVVSENVGVLLAADLAEKLEGPAGVRLESLAGLDWFAFARAGSPAWYDELAATLRSHGLDVGPEVPEDQRLIVELKIPAVSSGAAYAFAPPEWPYPMPDTVRWLPLAGNPIVRRTWAVWPATSHRRDLAKFVAALEDHRRGESRA